MLGLERDFKHEKWYKRTATVAAAVCKGLKDLDWIGEFPSLGLRQICLALLNHKMEGLDCRAWELSWTKHVIAGYKRIELVWLLKQPCSIMTHVTMQNLDPDKSSMTWAKWALVWNNVNSCRHSCTDVHRPGAETLSVQLAAPLHEMLQRPEPCPGCLSDPVPAKVNHVRYLLYHGTLVSFTQRSQKRGTALHIETLIRLTRQCMRCL